MGGGRGPGEVTWNGEGFPEGGSFEIRRDHLEVWRLFGIVEWFRAQAPSERRVFRHQIMSNVGLLNRRRRPKKDVFFGAEILQPVRWGGGWSSPTFAVFCFLRVFHWKLPLWLGCLTAGIEMPWLGMCLGTLRTFHSPWSWPDVVWGGNNLYLNSDF